MRDMTHPEHSERCEHPEHPEHSRLWEQTLDTFARARVRVLDHRIALARLEWLACGVEVARLEQTRAQVMGVGDA
jgi:hypothetical protein